MSQRPKRKCVKSHLYDDNFRSPSPNPKAKRKSNFRKSLKSQLHDEAEVEVKQEVPFENDFLVDPNPQLDEIHLKMRGIRDMYVCTGYKPVRRSFTKAEILELNRLRVDCTNFGLQKEFSALLRDIAFQSKRSLESLQGRLHRAARITKIIAEEEFKVDLPHDVEEAMQYAFDKYLQPERAEPGFQFPSKDYCELNVLRVKCYKHSLFMHREFKALCGQIAKHHGRDETCFYSTLTSKGYELRAFCRLEGKEEDPFVDPDEPSVGGTEALLFLEEGRKKFMNRESENLIRDPTTLKFVKSFYEEMDKIRRVCMENKMENEFFKFRGELAEYWGLTPLSLRQKMDQYRRRNRAKSSPRMVPTGSQSISTKIAALNGDSKLSEALEALKAGREKFLDLNSEGIVKVSQQKFARGFYDEMERIRQICKTNSAMLQFSDFVRDVAEFWGTSAYCLDKCMQFRRKSVKDSQNISSVEVNEELHKARETFLNDGAGDLVKGASGFLDSFLDEMIRIRDVCLSHSCEKSFMAFCMDVAELYGCTPGLFSIALKRRQKYHEARKKFNSAPHPLVIEVLEKARKDMLNLENCSFFVDSYGKGTSLLYDELLRILEVCEENDCSIAFEDFCSEVAQHLKKTVKQIKVGMKGRRRTLKNSQYGAATSLDNLISMTMGVHSKQHENDKTMESLKSAEDNVNRHRKTKVEVQSLFSCGNESANALEWKTVKTFCAKIPCSPSHGIKKGIDVTSGALLTPKTET